MVFGQFNSQVEKGERTARWRVRKLQVFEQKVFLMSAELSGGENERRGAAAETKVLGLVA